ncbi:MAG: peptide chain release factor 2 [Synergistaceae bacterium]|nr:peptide chain release factor 2 [Synergistaceae bacterium]
MIDLSVTSVMMNLHSSYDELRGSLDLATIEKRIEELRKIAEQPDFWKLKDAQDISKETVMLQNKINKLNAVSGEIEELETYAELLNELEDVELQKEFYRRSSLLQKNIEEYQTLILLDGAYDTAGAILSVHAGAGGLDSQDWTAILYRMYIRWSESHNYTVKLIDEITDQEAGIKSVTVSINGDYAYGFLRGEQGVHRLIRISPYDSAKRRHTSFASVEVTPILPDNVELAIKPEDLKIDTFRSGGAGGQHVNMTDSAVRITHIPSGIVVSCQAERSQHMNRATAMQVLRSRLYERMLAERRNHMDDLQGEKREISWGSQIRSYTLHPFQLVKDHRSSYETGNTQAVLDGEIDDFIMNYLRFQKTTG